MSASPPVTGTASRKTALSSSPPVSTVRYGEKHKMRTPEELDALIAARDLEVDR